MAWRCRGRGARVGGRLQRGAVAASDGCARAGSRCGRHCAIVTQVKRSCAWPASRFHPTHVAAGQRACLKGPLARWRTNPGRTRASRGPSERAQTASLSPSRWHTRSYVGRRGGLENASDAFLQGGSAQRPGGDACHSLLRPSENESVQGRASCEVSLSLEKKPGAHLAAPRPAVLLAGRLHTQGVPLSRVGERPVGAGGRGPHMRAPHPGTFALERVGEQPCLGRRRAMRAPLLLRAHTRTQFRAARACVHKCRGLTGGPAPRPWATLSDPTVSLSCPAVSALHGPAAGASSGTRTPSQSELLDEDPLVRGAGHGSVSLFSACGDGEVCLPGVQERVQQA